MHYKTKDLKCDLCSFQTSYKDSIKRHKKLFHGVKLAPDKSKDPPEHQPPDMIKNIKQERESDDQERSHKSGVSWHKCNKCSYVTVKHCNLLRHVKAMHDKVKKNLRLHMRKQHNTLEQTDINSKSCLYSYTQLKVLEYQWNSNLIMGIVVSFCELK